MLKYEKAWRYNDNDCILNCIRMKDKRIIICPKWLKEPAWKKVVRWKRSLFDMTPLQIRADMLRRKLANI